MYFRWYNLKIHFKFNIHFRLYNFQIIKHFFDARYLHDFLFTLLLSCETNFNQPHNSRN